MTWQGVQGHDSQVDRFRRMLASGRLASTFLFIGPSGVGKRLFAERLAQALLCETRPAEALEPCGHCSACRQVLALTHPDLMIVAKPKDKSTIPLELLIGSGEKRMREGLCHDLGLKSFAGGPKIAIIDDADFLNVEGANCLLKTLEEPPPKSLLILIGTSLQRQLPTIRSRSLIVRFDPLSPEILADLLLQQEAVANQDEALRLAHYAEGSLTQAKALADPELWKFRDELLAALSASPFDNVRAARRTAAFVESAGTEASLRRNRLRQVLGFAGDFYRGVLRSSVGANTGADAQLATSIARGLAAVGTDVDRITATIETTNTALGYIDRNINATTVVEWWLDEIRRAVKQPQSAATR